MSYSRGVQGSKVFNDFNYTSEVFKLRQGGVQRSEIGSCSVFKQATKNHWKDRLKAKVR